MKHTSKIQAEFVKLAKCKIAVEQDGTLHKEREKRLTLLELPEECKDIKPIIIKQGVLNEVRGDDGKNIAYARVRSTQDTNTEDKCEYSLGVKQMKLQQEVETEISKEMFDTFFPKNVLKPQVKLRYCLSNGWDVDQIVHSDIKNGKQPDEIYAEYEHEKDETVKVPSNWKVQ
jgi:hypothetical protein